MQSVVKKSAKTVDQYRHNIKLLKYHLKKEQKMNETLRYKQAKKHKQKSVIQQQKTISSPIYSLVQTVNSFAQRLKEMGLTLGDIYRMADSQYSGEITKEQFMRCILRIKANLEEQHINQMFYTIDSDLNGMLSEDQYLAFLCAYGGAQSKEAMSYQKQSSQAFAACLQKKSIKVQDFVSNMLDPFTATEMHLKLKNLGMNANQNMALLKLWDPSLTGSIRHEVYLKSMQTVKRKSQKQLHYEKIQKGVRQLCILLRDRKLNPIIVFEEAQADGRQGISAVQLEESFRKMFPQQTSFQIKKWVNLINLNNDSEITKEEFLSAIRGFYSLQQLDKFSSDYEKLHPQLKKQLEQGDIPVQKIIRELQMAIEDQGLTKQQTFNRIDINHNGLVDKEELAEGLKHIGISFGTIAKVITMFDRDASGEVSLQEWLHILGQDVQMEDVPLPGQSKVKSEKESKVKPNKVEDKKNKQNAKKTKKEPEMPTIKTNNIQSKLEPEMPTIKTNNIQSKIKDQVKASESQKNILKKKQPKIADKSPIDKKDKAVKKVQISEQKDKVKLQKTQNKVQQKTSLKEKSQKAPVIDKSKEKLSKPQPAKQPVAKPSKPNKKPVQKEKVQQQSINQLDNLVTEEAIVDSDELQKEIGQKYAQSPRKIKQAFKSHLSKGSKGLKLAQLEQCLIKLGLKTTYGDKQVRNIFQNNCSTESGGLFAYEQFLDELVSRFELNLKEEPKQPVKLAEKIQIKKEAKVQPKKEQKVQPKQQPDSKTQKRVEPQKEEVLQSQAQYEQSFQKQSAVSPKKKQGEKRGEDMQQFKILQQFILKEQTHTNQGYKLSAYLDCKEEMQLLNKKYLPLAESLKKNKRLFEDKSFAKGMTSLTTLPPNQSKIDNVGVIKWKHYKQLYKNPELFKDDIKPTDIKQGELGDCYFLCALSSIAEYGKLIQRMFEYYDIENGYFLVWICLNGCWKLIQLDGYLPVEATGKRPVFSRGQGEQLWVMILEKAYAKVYGNYEHIVGGQPYEAIKDLTGAPGQSFSHKTVQMQQVWNKLNKANTNQFMMSCGTDQSQEAQTQMNGHSEGVTNQGLVLGHAYSILDVQQYKKQRLIQLRNPWGETQWKGVWSDNSNKWTAEAKSALNYTNFAEDGIFWMPFEAFFKKYATSTINYIRPNYFYKSQTLTSVKTLVISLSGQQQWKHGFIMVTQQDHRMQGLQANTPYNLCHIIAIKLKNGKVIKKIADEKYLYQREASIEIQREVGQDVVIMVSLQKMTNINISTYGQGAMPYQFDKNFQTMLGYMQSMAKIEQDAKNIQVSKGWFKQWSTSVGEVAFLVFKSTEQKAYTLDLNLQNPKNISLFPQGKQRYIKLEPGVAECVKGKIENMKAPWSFGPMRYGKKQ